jgi:hypothetical protein
MVSLSRVHQDQLHNSVAERGHLWPKDASDSHGQLKEVGFFP